MMDWNQLLNSERRRTTTNPTDHRLEFERDHDRVVFSSPLKRLQDKAQVFPLETHDGVRNRLTHSLEVASVARGLATKVCRWLVQDGHISANQDRQIETIATTCGLLHDLGNPPFGHAGETAIQDACRDLLGRDELKEVNDRKDLANDFLKFEGNAQSLRLVSCLQVMADEFGLNLTYGTLSASCKYVADSTSAVSNHLNHAFSKPGYFRSEADVVQDIRRKTGTGDARNPITFLVEAADDIVYSVADIEDACKKGILSWGRLEELLRTEMGDESHLFEETLEGAKRVLQGKWGPDIADEIRCSAFRTAFIGRMVEQLNSVFKSNYSSVMDGRYSGELVKSTDAHALLEALKSVGRKHVYCTRPNLTLELMGRKVIHDLVQLIWEGASIYPKQGKPRTRSFAEKICNLISPNYCDVFQRNVHRDNYPEAYWRLQLVTDYVSGMTDSFAKRLHQELTNA